MTLQEAYNKGLDDAESRIIAVFIDILKNGNIQNHTFPNPKLEAVKVVVEKRSDYYHSLAKRNNNIGKTFRKKILEENQLIDNLNV